MRDFTSNRFVNMPLIFIALAMLLFLPGKTIQSQQVDSDSVKIGVLIKRSAEICLEKWRPTADYLTEKISGHSFTIVLLGFDKVNPAVERGEVDFILANSSFYVGLEYYYGASRIATLKNLRLGKPFTVYGGVIFCRADSEDLKHLTDLKGKDLHGC